MYFIQQNKAVLRSWILLYSAYHKVNSAAFDAVSC